MHPTSSWSLADILSPQWNKVLLNTFFPRAEGKEDTKWQETILESNFRWRWKTKLRTPKDSHLYHAGQRLGKNQTGNGALPLQMTNCLLAKPKCLTTNNARYCLIISHPIRHLTHMYCPGVGRAMLHKVCWKWQPCRQREQLWLTWSLMQPQAEFCCKGKHLYGFNICLISSSVVSPLK